MNSIEFEQHKESTYLMKFNVIKIEKYKYNSGEGWKNA